jgi:hypothetical protein
MTEQLTVDLEHRYADLESCRIRYVARRAIYHEAWSQPGALRGGIIYYRAARMGEQVAARLPPAGCRRNTRA